MRKLLAASVAVIAIAGLAGSAGAITNGTPDTANPYVGAMTGLDPGGTPRQCSGAVIADGVFLTAGHCAVLTGVELHFGADISDPGHQVVPAIDVLQHPQYTHSLGKSFDVGIVTFATGSVTDMGMLAPAGYVDQFTKDELRATTFETIGYGLVRNDTNGNSAPLMPGTERRIATQTYLNSHNQYLGLSMHNNKGNGGGCFGDSGGPHLMDGYIVSVTSNGDGNCVATDNTQRIDQPGIHDWIMDITAIHAAGS